MSTRFVRIGTLALCVSMGALGCGGELVVEEGGGGAGGGGDGPGELFPLACDPLVPSYCGFPFPSDAYTVADETTPTGRRVAFKTEGLPVSKDGHRQDPAPWSRADGFSASSSLVTHFPGAVAVGLPGVLDIESSMAADSLTVIIDAQTGERIPHYSEIDVSKDFDENASLIVRPVVPLRDGARYLAVVRGLVDASGSPIEASPAFAALRDGTASDEPSVEARRDGYEGIFGTLEDAGIPREDLLLAWDFTTASRKSNTDWLLHIRDEATEIVGASGPAYTITSVDSDLDPANILYRIKGTMTVPLYLDKPDAGATLLFGDDGLPEPNPTTPTYEVEWELLIPNIAQDQPVALLQHGHGLLGSSRQLEAEHFRTFCNTYGYAIFGTRLAGMAEDDQEFIIEQLVNGKIDGVTKMFDRLHQGFLDNLMVMKVMRYGMANDPTYGAYLDPERRNYWGISQGGIQGGVLMSLSTDIDRGVLEVMGQPYNLLLNRSVDFGPFFVVAGIQFPDSRAQQHMLGLVQMGWDRVEPSGYTKYMFDDPFPGAPAGRRVLMRTAVGDHQVPTFGGHVMARAMNATHLDSGIRDIFGLEKGSGGAIDDVGAVYTEYAFGLPPEPTCNVPMVACDDPHGKLGKLDAAREQSHLFYSTGVFENRCPGQVCSYPELSGCNGDEDPNRCD